jgi:hypothetical protein
MIGIRFVSMLYGLPMGSVIFQSLEITKLNQCFLNRFGSSYFKIHGKPVRTAKHRNPPTSQRANPSKFGCFSRPHPVQLNQATACPTKEIHEKRSSADQIGSRLTTCSSTLF